VAREQKAIYLVIGGLSSEVQQQARALGKLQRQLEQGESILVEELGMFERTIGMLDKESKTIEAEIVAKVNAEFQAQKARQAEQGNIANDRTSNFETVSSK